MILYLSIIIVSMIIITIFNAVFNLQNFSSNVLIVIACVTVATLIEIVIDLILAWIIHSQKDKYFENKRFFEVSAKERKFYEKLKIRSWKDKILELGSLGGFKKSKLTSSSDINYINTFLMECYKGQIVHIFNVILGFLILLIPPYKWTWCVALPVALVNAFLGILPIFVLRYNVPKLLAAKTRLTRQKTSTK